VERLWYALGFLIVFILFLMDANRSHVSKWAVEHGITGPYAFLVACGFALALLLITFLIATTPFAKRKKL
jgi:uncharacterized membrane protein YdjX (TVP38/TMEM64 family)